ncbi:unnamed protein product [Linum tenue]|uniref:Receptor-like serine/threonine-protein kinase n=1 Tax=Linum tenue TaxID=586396 RepID=A0AAV0GS03_9ROSI|nr:unnamed protein product [Linum tenue]
MAKTTLSFKRRVTLHFCFFLFALILVTSENSSTVLIPGQFLRDSQNQTLVSPDKTFELGFFTPGTAGGSSNNRYLGIWYHNAPAKEVVWVANRNASLSDTSGALSLSPTGILVLLNNQNKTIWTSNNGNPSQAATPNPTLQLLDSGNLVVIDGNRVGILWQSFDHPSNTLLPGMKIRSNFATGKQTFLTSWKTDQDPDEGRFSMSIDPRGYPQLILKNGEENRYRLGSWNGKYFTGTPLLPENNIFEYEFVMNKTDVYYTYNVKSALLSRLVLNQTGFLQRYARSQGRSEWTSLYGAPMDQCDLYGNCGAHMTCNMEENSPPTCDCLDEFELIDPENQSKGCARKVPLNCENEYFWNYTRVKLPDTSTSSWFSEIRSLGECQEVCLRNCSCMAYADADITKADGGCLMWFGELVDMRQYDSGGQELFVRLSAAVPKSPATLNSGGKNLVAIVASSVGLAGLAGTVLVLVLWHRRQRSLGMRGASIFRRDGGNEEGGEDSEMELHIFDRATMVKATDNFSTENKLGQGGYGPVYKGTLADGQEIAVKTLSKSSGQGTTEFKNEVVLIAKLQHRNLVKLLGCCIEGDEKMLIYEFMPNKSLDFFIFDKTKSKSLDWNMRIAIVNGIARGLLYLHQDSRLRIIHRDLKASNVLLDKDMNPKISDFGMARIFGGDQIEANTSKVVGTYGYMSPEYAIDGLFSMKSDVFSFGVLLLEIISGKRNRGFSHQDHNLNLLGHAWRLWIEGKPIELVEEEIVDDELSTTTQVLRCIQVGLLCVQQRPDDRPSMSSVVVMLTSETLLPQPKQPGFFTERNLPDSESSTSDNKHNSASVNEVTISLLDAR